MKRAFCKNSFKLSIIPILILFSGCAAGLEYSKLETQMIKADCGGAIEYIKSNKDTYGTNMHLNYLLDMAMINLQCGNYEASNQHFKEAEDLAEKLWTKSISSEAAAFLVNDYTIPYDGEDFERAGINLFSALTYALKGDHEGALVECRRLDSVLTMYNDEYEKKNVYKEDAFGRYLSAMIYEAEGELEDAYIDYYKALKTYDDYEKNYSTAKPRILLEDIKRVAIATDRTSELEEELSELRDIETISNDKARKMGKVVLIHLNGKSPIKKSRTITAPSTKGPISIAFPQYEVQQPSCTNTKIIARAGSTTVTANAELVEDINKIAVKNLEDRKGRVLVKAIARAVAKQAAANNLIEDDRLKAVFNILNTAAIERADTRTWRTLPGEVTMTRLFLEAGDYTIYGSNCGRERPLKNVSLKPGKTEFVLFDTIY